uniref:Uncharacterized protein n=1 Tax=uncultured marine virus TaxID=186617 RepID=A0A0F7L5R9_9VIRU|nr:hypothetical protein [uncultured marine virus]
MSVSCSPSENGQGPKPPPVQVLVCRTILRIHANNRCRDRGNVGRSRPRRNVVTHNADIPLGADV